MQRKIQRDMKPWQRAVIKLILPPVAAAGLLFCGATGGFANPTDGTVTTGAGTITSNGTTTTITQTSDKLAVNWQSFNIASGETVNFVQPGSTAIALNRVIGSDPSAIYGTLSANGKVFLINPNGILFSSTAQVNVGGLVASTLDLSDSDFRAGNYIFGGFGGNGAVVNQGTINTTAGGYVALLGSRVSNEGVIVARQGMAALGAGNQITLDFDGDGLLSLAVDQAALGALVENKQLARIQADGGRVIMTAKAADELAGTVVNNSGLIQAQSISNVNGEIILDGGTNGTVNVYGTLDVSGQATGETGGTIKVLGNNVAISAATIDASGDAGGGIILVGGNAHGQGPERNATTTTIGQGASLNADAVTRGNGGQVVGWSDGTTNFAGTISARGGSLAGNGGSVETSGQKMLTVADTARVSTGAANGTVGNWLLDPESFTIADNGGNITPSILAATLSNTNVTITTGDSVTVTGIPGSYPGTSGSGDITVGSDITWSGTGVLTLSAYRNIAINADISITDTGSATHAGLALNYGTGTSGSYSLGNGASVSFAGSAPSLTIKGQNYNLISNSADLQAMSSGLNKNYALATDITVGSFTPIGYDLDHPFRGVFDGLGHVIVFQQHSGLFNSSAGTIRNVGLTGESASGGGALVGGDNSGNIINCYSTRNVTGSECVGGLVSYNWGNITNCYSSGTVSGSLDEIGGLVGENDGGSIINSYSTGAVSGRNKVGGLVGYTFSKSGSTTITNSYSTGAVSGNWDVGGLIGWHDHATGNFSVGISTVTDCYSTGTVVGHLDVGGLVGLNFASISNCYSTGHVSGNAGGGVGGLVGSNESQIYQITNCYWDQDTSGMTLGVGDNIGTVSNIIAVRSSTGTAYSKNSYSNFDSFDTNWYIIEGQTRPFLRSEYSTTISNAHQLQLMNMDPSASYALVNNIDMSELAQASGMWKTATGFAPVGSSLASFIGVFDGLGHTISNLSINLPSTSYAGLFGYSSGVIRNVGLVGGSVTGNNDVGGLVGYNDYGSITNCYSTSAVNGSGGVGGLIGYNDNGSITNSYNTGAVSGASNVGGLAGYNDSGSITNSYSVGVVHGTSSVGGLLGNNNAGMVTASYWDTQTSGISTSAAGLGLTTDRMMQLSNYPQGNGQWDFANTWGIVDGKSYPYLRWQFSGTPQIVSGTATGEGDGLTVRVAVNGTLLASATTGANGFYYFALPGNSVPSGSDLLTYVSGYAGFQGNAVYRSDGSHITGLNITANTVAVDGGPGTALLDVNSTLNTAKGGLTDTDILFGAGSVNGAVTISAANTGVTFSGPLTASGNLTASAHGNLTLNSGASLRSTSGNVTLAANGGHFINNGSSFDISVSGRWLVYSAGPAGDASGGLVYDFTQYNTAYGGTVQGAGNGFIYSNTLNLSAGLTGTVAKIYDGNNIADLTGANYQLLGLTGGTGTFANSPGLHGGTYDTKNVGSGKLITAADTAVLSAGVTDAAGKPVYGYSFDGTGASGNIGAISQAELKISTAPVSKIYDGTTAATGSALVTDGSLYDSDSISGGSFAFANPNAGSNKTVTVSGVTVNDGNGGGNYHIAYVNNTVSTISPASLTVTANNDSKVYNGSTYRGGNGVNYNGLVNGETSEVLSGILTYGGDSQGAIKVGTYTIIPGGLSSSNYTISYANGTLTIRPSDSYNSAIAIAYTGGTGGTGGMGGTGRTDGGPERTGFGGDFGGVFNGLSGGSDLFTIETDNREQ